MTPYDILGVLPGKAGLPGARSVLLVPGDGASSLLACARETGWRRFLARVMLKIG